MAKDKKVLTDEHKQILRRHNLNPQCWELRQDMPNSMIIKHRITGEFKVIEKGRAR